MVGDPDFLTGAAFEQGSEFPELETPEGDLHLRFFVPSGEEFALPATAIKEVISSSPEQITPIPNVSPLLLGNLNVRGRVIWVADLGQFLGDTTPLSTDRAEIDVIAVEEQDVVLGLAIEGIGRMQWLSDKQLQAPNDAPNSMAPFLRGEWVFEEPYQVLRLLDRAAIVRSARWAA